MTQTDVGEIESYLRYIVKSLDGKETDKSELSKLVKDLENKTKEDKYTKAEDSRKIVYDLAVEEAQKILSKEKATQEEVNLAKKHLSIVTQSMKDISDNAKKVLSAVDGTRNAVDGVIKNTQSSFKGLLSPIKDIQNVAKETEEKWNKTFMSLADLNPKNLTYSTLQGSNSYINAQVQQNNKEAVTETQAIMAGLAPSLKIELKQLRLNRLDIREGQRDLA